MTTRIIRIVIDSKGARKGGKDVEGALGGVEKKAKGAGGALTSVKGALIATAAVLIAKKIIATGDAWASLQGQLRLVTGSSAELETTTKALFDISQRTRQALQGTADLYVRLGRSTDFTNDRILQLTETIGQTIALSRASPEAAKAALFQLGQGFAAGALRGEELNSVLEQTPELAKAISDGLGVTLGQLRILGAQGALTAEKVAEGLEASADAVNEEFGTIPLTVGDAVTRVQNSMFQFIGTLDTAVGATALLAQGVNKVSEVIQGLGVILGDDKGFGVEAGKVGVKIDDLADRIVDLQATVKGGVTFFVDESDLVGANFELELSVRKLAQLKQLQLELIENGGLTNAEREIKDLEDLRGSIALTVQKTQALFAIKDADTKLADAFKRVDDAVTAIQKKLDKGLIKPDEAAELTELLESTFKAAEGREADRFVKTFEDATSKAKAQLLLLNDFIERELIDDDVAASIREKLTAAIVGETDQELADKFAEQFETAADKAKDQIELLDEFVRKNLIDVETATAIRLRLEKIVADDLIIVLKADVQAFQDVEQRIEDLRDKIAAFSTGGAEALSATESFQEARDIIEAMGDEATITVQELTVLIETEKALAESLSDVEDEFNKQGDAVEDFFRRARENSQDILADFFAGGFDSLDDFSAAFAKMLLNLASQALAAEIFNLILGPPGGGGSGGLIQTAIGAAGQFFGGGEHGADVGGGDFGVVGESGPEVFQAPTAGRIVPNASAAAAPEVTVPVQVINVRDPSEIPAALGSDESKAAILNMVSENRNAFSSALGGTG
jgi:tape measure domain-containing protein